MRPDPHSFVENHVKFKLALGADESELYKYCARYYSFSLPNQPALECLAELSPLLDLGAGNAYWPWRLTQMGADVLPVDAAIVGMVPENPAMKFVKGDQRMVADYPERTLMMVWPSENELWATEAVEYYSQAGGRTVAYIGDPLYQRTATEDLPRKLVQRGFQQTDRIMIGSWSWLRDTLDVWKLP